MPKILVADDDPKLGWIIAQYLERRNWHVITALDGEEALAKIAHDRPDLIVADIGMPKVDGFALLSRLRRDPATRTIPFIFLTGRQHDTERLKALRVGADDYLTKPCALDRLARSIDTIIDRITEARHMPLEQIGFSGRIEDVDLLDMIQTIELELKTGALVLSHGERTGTLYFRDGAIVDAQLRSSIHEEPLFRLLGWKTGRFLFIPDALPERMPITASLAHLLLQDIRTLEGHTRAINQFVPREGSQPGLGSQGALLDRIATDLEELVRRHPVPSGTDGPSVLRIVVAGVEQSGTGDFVRSLVSDLSPSRWAVTGTERLKGLLPAEMGCVRISSRVVLHLLAIRAEKRFRALWEQCLPEAIGIIVLTPGHPSDAEQHLMAFLEARNDLAPTTPVQVLVENREQGADAYAAGLTIGRLATWSGLHASALSSGWIHDQAVRLDVVGGLLRQCMGACPSPALNSQETTSRFLTS